MPGPSQITQALGQSGRSDAQQLQRVGAAELAGVVAGGQKLFRGGDQAKGLPACAGCHGPTGAGIPAQYPRIGGQFSEYLEAQLKTFREGSRANDPKR